MTEKLEYKGLWFLPDNPEDKIEGTLIFDPDDSISLNLIGTFKEFTDKLDEIDIILGFTTEGKNISLIQCYESNRSMNFPGIPTTRYNANFFLEGAHFTTINNIKFYKLSSKIAKLEEWVNIWGFKISFAPETKELNTNFNIPNDVLFNINENIKGMFRFYYKPDLMPKSDYRIEQTTKLEFVSEVEIPYNDFLKLLFNFKSFITLGVFDDVYINEIELYSSSVFYEHSDGYKYETPVKLYFLQSHINKEIYKRNYHDFLFDFRQIETNFDSIIQKWFHLYESISPVLNVLSDTFSKKRVYNENVFLDIVQALEIYHRRVKEDTDKLKAEFHATLDPIFSVLDKDQKNWLSEKLEYKFEPSLRKRLNDLFQEFSIKPLSEIIVSKRELKILINKTTISRNYYTHYNTDLKGQACHGLALYLLSEKLKILLFIVILRETGFDNNEIENLFKTKSFRYFNHIMQK